MSYRNDMERFREEQNARRRWVTLIIKITVFALAALILATAATAGITLLIGGDKPEAEEDGDGSPSGGFRITGPRGDTVTLMIGDKPLYKSYVDVSDESAQLDVDNSEVDTSKAGTYRVRYTATNSAGKKATYTLTVIVSADPTYTEERLMTIIAAKAQELGITKSMSKTEQVRKIYDYVKDPNATKDMARIYFSDESNALGQKAQSGIRTGWESDWVEEAIRTLSMGRMKGDCYSYYAVSKAFFEYFGIENVGIQRSAGSSHSGTHFWHAVNVGTKESPKWYYYDATRLAGSFSDGGSNSCLITEEKLASYRTSKGESGFYTFDKSQYKNFPTIETTPLS